MAYSHYDIVLWSSKFTKSTDCELVGASGYGRTLGLLGPLLKRKVLECQKQHASTVYCTQNPKALDAEPDSGRHHMS